MEFNFFVFTVEVFKFPEFHEIRSDLKKRGLREVRRQKFVKITGKIVMKLCKISF